MAYPADAMVRQWNRTYRLNRGEDFRIHDDFDLLRAASAPTSINFMTCCEISERGPGRLMLYGDGFRLMLNYDPRKVRPVVELIEIGDENLARDWPGGVARIVFKWLGGRSGQNEIVLKADQ